MTTIPKKRTIRKGNFVKNTLKTTRGIQATYKNYYLTSKNQLSNVNTRTTNLSSSVRGDIMTIRKRLEPRQALRSRNRRILEPRQALRSRNRRIGTGEPTLKIPNRPTNHTPRSPNQSTNPTPKFHHQNTTQFRSPQQLRRIPQLGIRRLSHSRLRPNSAKGGTKLRRIPQLGIRRPSHSRLRPNSAKRRQQHVLR